MSEQTRGVIFVVLVVAITFVWVHFFSPPPQPPLKPGQTVGMMAPGQSAGSGQAGAMQASASGAPARPVTIPAAQAADEENIVVESPLYRIELSNRGGVVRSWELKKYSDDLTPPHLLDLVNPISSQELGWPFSLMLSDRQLEAEANSGLYTVMPDLENLSAPAQITFHWSDG